jgi:hypothetical protein
MSSDITVPGVSQLNGPGIFTSVVVPGSGGGGAITPQFVLLLANGLSSSLANTSATNSPGTLYGSNTLTPINTVSDMINFAGAGSPAHLGFAAFRAVNQSTPVFYSPIECPTSATASTQTGTVTVSGTVTSGIVNYFVAGQNPVPTQYFSTDTASTLATRIAASITATQYLPVTATASGGTITVTAKVAAQRGNFLRGFFQVVGGSGVTVTPSTPTFFTGGTGSDASISGGGGYLQVLNAIASTRNLFAYVVPECGWDSVDGYNLLAANYSNYPVAQVQNFIDSQAQPSVGLRMRAIFGFNDSFAHAQNTSLDVNDVRLEAWGLPNSDLTPFLLAVNSALAVTLFETTPLSPAGVNYDNFGGDPVSAPFWKVPAPLDGSSPSVTQLQAAALAGITPIGVVAQTQRTTVFQRCTSYFYPPGQPTLLDLRGQDGGSMTTNDRFWNDVNSRLRATTYRSVINPNTSATGSSPNPPNVVSADDVSDAVTFVVNQYAAAGLINGSQTLGTLVVRQNAYNTTSIGVQLTLYTSNLLHQILLSGQGLPALVIQ